jgi:hypothetical protein
MSGALYICIDCELANANAQPTPLNEHSLCPRCGSSSVVPVDTLLELDRKRKAEESAPPTVDKDHSKRVAAMRDQRLKDSQPLRQWLSSVCSTNQAIGLLDTLTKWDGWYWHIHYPWDPLTGFENNFVVELVQGVKNGPRWVIVLDSEVIEVRSFQNGAN